MDNPVDQERPVILDQAVFDLFDDYTHAPLPRRVFFARLAALTGSVAAASAILPLLDSNYAAEAAMVAADDGRLEIQRITYPGATGAIKAYQVRRKGAGKLPAIQVIHENRGLTGHIEDVTRRLALAGFLALGVDFMTPIGGTPADEDEARAKFRQLFRGDGARDTVRNGLAAVDFLKSHPQSTGKTGVIGFCWGGGMVNQIAVNSSVLDAGVVYYGRQPKDEDVAKIKAKLMIHYAALDRRINAGKDAYNAALNAAGVDFQEFLYDGAQHAFNNDTSAARYNEAAAKLAWERTVNFFKSSLA